MLQVGIHHRDVGCGGRQDALDACSGEAAPPEALHDSHASVGARHRPHGVCGTVRRVIVHEHDLPDDAIERGVQASDERRNVVALLEGRHDDR